MRWREGFHTLLHLHTVNKLTVVFALKKRSMYCASATRVHCWALDWVGVHFIAALRRLEQTNSTKLPCDGEADSVLVGTPRVVNLFSYQWQPPALDVYTDSDWTGDLRSHNSASKKESCMADKQSELKMV